MDDRTLIEQGDQTLGETVVESESGRKFAGWLTVWSGFQKGKDFPVCEGRNFAGSDKKCDIYIMDVYFPQFSFNIRVKDNVWTLVDLDSDTGIIVNDEAVFRKELQDEDWIKTGNIVFRIKKR